METVQQDLMYDAIARIKFGMTVDEAKRKGICIKCRRMVVFEDSQYANLALCPDCLVNCEHNSRITSEKEEV